MDTEKRIDIATREMEPVQAPAGMVWIPGSTFRMGSATFYPEERPVHDVTVDGFWMDAPNYCFRYRPAARQPRMIDTSMAHLGFRCVVRGAE